MKKLIPVYYGPSHPLKPGVIEGGNLRISYLNGRFKNGRSVPFPPPVYRRNPNIYSPPFRNPTQGR